MKNRDDGVGRWWIGCRWVVACVTFWAVAGCEDVYRINHFHSDSNQKLAEESLQHFESFVSDVDGLAPSLLRNVDARRKVEQAVADTRTRVRDVEWVTLTTDVTWEQLRLETLASLGLLSRNKDGVSVPLNLRDPEDLKYARILAAGWDPADPGRPQGDTLDDKLVARIGVRVVKVSAIAKVLQALAEAHRAEALEVAAKLKKLSDGAAAAAGEGGAGDAEQSTADDRLKWIRDLYATFKKIRADLRANPALLAEANELQRQILADIENSRDPEEATALVAVVGTGLSDNDFALLDKLLDFLENRLKGVASQPAPALVANASGDRREADDAWASLGRTLCQARAAVQFAIRIRDAQIDPPSIATVAKLKIDPGTADGLRRAAEQILSECDAEHGPVAARPPAAAPPAAVAAAPAPPPPPVGKAGAARIQSLRALNAPPAVPAAAADLAAPPPSGVDRSVKLFRALTTTSENRRAAAPPAADQPAIRLLRRADLQQTIQVISGVRKDTAAASAKIRRLAAAAPTSPAAVAKAVVRTVRGVGAAPAPATVRGIPTPAYKETVRQRIAALDREIADAAKPNAPPIDLRSAKDHKAELERELVALPITDEQAFKGLEFLNKYLSLDARVAGFADAAAKSIGEENLKYLGGVVNDIQREQTERHERILRFFRDLLTSQQDLAQENVRHADGMFTVSGIELRRWDLLASLENAYDDVYTFDAANDEVNKAAAAPANNAPGPDFAVTLFNTADYIERWSVVYPLAPRQNSEDPRAPGHPTILLGKPTVTVRNSAFVITRDRSDSVLASVRKLADTARTLHATPQSVDPTGFHTRAAHLRLFQAVRTVDGHLLMLSLNQHISEDNTVRLRTELATHDVNLDGLVARVEEAGYRFTLGDLQAFHSSGITDKDIQVVTSSITNALLGWIGVSAD